jgi:uncharacterized protein (DUF983 family)
MTTVDDYTDAREMIDGFEKERCRECGQVEWFKRLDREGWLKTQWNCQNCGAYLECSLEYPCTECGVALEWDHNRFVCNNVDCPVQYKEVNSEAIYARLTSDTYPERAHKPGVLMGECPSCGESNSVNGGPDGELECDECDFYAGQYQDSWYCYAIWMREKNKIRVTR